MIVKFRNSDLIVRLSNKPSIEKRLRRVESEVKRLYNAFEMLEEALAIACIVFAFSYFMYLTILS